MSLENPSLNQKIEGEDEKTAETGQFFVSETDSKGNVANETGKDFFISEAPQKDSEQASKVLDDINKNYVEPGESVNQEGEKTSENNFFVSEEKKKKSFWKKMFKL